MHVPVFDPARAIGGAEVMAVDIARALSADNDLTVLHGFWDEPREYRGPAFPAEILPAFPLGDQDWHRTGHVAPSFTPAARRKIAEAAVVVGIETTLNLPVAAMRVAVMGGVGYPHTHDILRHNCWDRLVVPSEFVARQVRETVTGDPRVTVIENGVDTVLFSPSAGRGRVTAAGERRLRLLIPSRPTLDKGFLRAVELAKDLEKQGHHVTLVVFDRVEGEYDEQPQPDSFSPEGLRKELMATNCEVEIHPWQPRSAMPGFYRAADLTLCLGSAAEGFGLTAAESVACGTPVLSHGGGFLREMLPEGHGLGLVDQAADPELLAERALETIAIGPGQCLEYGRPFIERRYGLHRMKQKYTELVRDISRRDC
jgi:glycosyltransferase involved in cell wall biosynthesis